MTDVASLAVGTPVWTRGRNEFGDQRTGGVVVRCDDNPDTGERFVLVLTDSPSTPRQDALILHKSKGGYVPLGLVARLERIAVADLDPQATAGERYPAAVWGAAIKALRASTLPPHDRLHSKGHDALLSAYRALRSEAEMLSRGVA